MLTPVYVLHVRVLSFINMKKIKWTWSWQKISYLICLVLWFDVVYFPGAGYYLATGFYQYKWSFSQYLWLKEQQFVFLCWAISRNQFADTLREYSNSVSIKILSFLSVSPCFSFLTKKQKINGKMILVQTFFLTVPSFKCVLLFDLQGFIIVAAV